MPWLILYDGVCGLCTTGVGFVIKQDPQKRFQFASLQSVLGQELLGKFGLPRHDFITFVLVTLEGHWTKSTAALKVMRKLGGCWSLFYGLIIIPEFLRDRVYDLVVKYRYRLLGQTTSCFLPSDDIRDRFVSYE